MTLHTVAIVLKQSVVFSMGRFLFCKKTTTEKQNEDAFTSLFGSVHRFLSSALPRIQTLLCRHLMFSAWAWHRHRTEISDWRVHCWLHSHHPPERYWKYRHCKFPAFLEVKGQGRLQNRDPGAQKDSGISSYKLEACIKKKTTQKTSMLTTSPCNTYYIMWGYIFFSWSLPCSKMLLPNKTKNQLKENQTVQDLYCDEFCYLNISWDNFIWKKCYLEILVLFGIMQLQ